MTRISNPKTKNSKDGTEIVKELSRLKRTYGYGLNLVVKWIPNHRNDKHGEVLGEVIYIYDEELEEAIKTLKHEYFDFILTREIIDPLINLINLQTKAIVREVYRRKEELLERISNKL